MKDAPFALGIIVLVILLQYHCTAVDGDHCDIALTWIKYQIWAPVSPPFVTQVHSQKIQSNFTH